MAIFHVDYTNGSNSNDGSAANPYATIVYAIQNNTLVNGDTIKVATQGGETVVETAATLKAAQGNDYKILETPTDLTGSISVGDIVRIDSPYTETNGWMVARVTSISATEIQFYEDMYLPGTLGTGNYSISTFQMDSESTAGTFEDFGSGSAKLVDIIGGYNTAFTSIIGRTHFRKSGQSAGGSSGTCFKVRSTNNNIDTWNFENFGWYEWQKATEGEFGGSIYGDNLLSYQQSSNAYTNYGAVWNKSGENGNLYFVNCSYIGASNSYRSNFVAAGYSTWFNIGVYGGQRNFRWDTLDINNGVMWNPGQNAFSSQFGSTNSFYIQNFTTLVRNNITVNGIEASRPGYNKNQELFGANGDRASVFGKINSFDFKTGGATDCYYNWYSSSDGEASRFICNLTMPTGYDLSDENLSSSRDTTGKLGTMHVINTDNHSWIKSNGAWVTEDSTVFDTGTNSKLIYFSTKDAYAVDDCRPMLFGMQKGTTVPASVTIRSRVIPHNKAGQQNNIRGFVGCEAAGSASLATNTVTISNTTGWSDTTFNFSMTQAQYTNYVADGFLTFTYTASNQDGQKWYVDSITVNY